MLKQRVITALILTPLVIWAILQASTQGFTYGLALVLFLATLEWNNFVNYKNKVSGWLFSILVTSCFLYLEYLANIRFIHYVIYLSLIWWLISLPLLFSFPFKRTHFLQQKSAKVSVGFVMLLATFLAFNLLRNSVEYGSVYVIYLLMIIWIADSAAYFAGRAWGKRKLMPNVSPGKSWEGVAGALVATLFAALIGIAVLKISSTQLFLFILTTLITVIYSVIGDLSESMFKRMANVKDSGKILPGHGGILDRIDSLTSALPVFLAGLWLMEALQ
jgi:phosphatidate cytidylyltransferase